MVSCRRTVASPHLPTVALLVVSLLLALEHPVADARHLKSSPSTPVVSAAADSSSGNGGLQGVRTRKLDVGKTKRSFVEAVEVKAPNKGNEGEQQSFGSSSSIGNGGSSSTGGVESDKLVVVERRGPTPHPKKHNL